MSRPIFTVYSKDGCKFCDLAKDSIKDIINDMGGDIGVDLRIVHNPEQQVITDMKVVYNHTTYPFIFFEGEFIGGYNEFKKNTSRIIKRLSEIYFDIEF